MFLRASISGDRRSGLVPEQGFELKIAVGVDDTGRPANPQGACIEGGVGPRSSASTVVAVRL